VADISTLTWVLTVLLVLVLLSVDFVVATLRPHRVGFGEAVAWSVGYIAVAVVFGVWFSLAYGGGLGSEFFAGFVVEKSLSVDNLFVFVIIMRTFSVPEEHQHRALSSGSALGLVLRAIGVALGATLLPLFSVMFLLFGVLLIWTAVQLFRHRDQDPDIEDNPVVSAARRLLPVTDRFAGGRLLTRIDGRRMVTPMFIVLVAIGSVDLLFALDSIPAVFGVTEHAYVVFAANAFALLGLRALYLLVTGLLDRLVYLSAGLSVILAFIGVKLILHWAHSDIDPRVPQISTPVSLAVIGAVLLVVVLASVARTRRDPAARARPGSLRVRGPRRVRRGPAATDGAEVADDAGSSEKEAG
jgi:tellurite resistance protein TerC